MRERGGGGGIAGGREGRGDRRREGGGGRRGEGGGGRGRG